MTVEEYKAQKGLQTAMTRAVHKPCSLCGASVLWCRTKLRCHAKKVHAITLKQLYHSHKNPDAIPEEEEEDIICVGEVESGCSMPYKSWVSQCEFKCRVCGKMYHLYNGFRQHLISNHQLSVSEYKAEFNNCSLMTRRRVLTCVICSNRKITWSYFSLRDHAKNVHHLSVKQFYREHMRALGKGGSVATVNSQDKSPEETADFGTLCVGEGENGSSMSYKSWLSQCQFKCRVCERNYHHASGLVQHLRASHQMSVSEYKSKFNNCSLMTRRRRMTCSICGRSVTWSYHNLTQHARSVHHISLKQFYHEHTKALGKDSSVAGVDSQDVSQESPVETADLLPTWARGCQFKCLECGTVFYRYNKLYNHLVKVHSRNVAEYKRAHGISSTMTKRKHFKCLLCSSQVLHNYDALLSHAKIRHGMSLSQLRREHLKNGPRQEEGEEEEGEVGATRVVVVTDEVLERWARGCEFKCLECGRVFYRKKSLRVHLASNHSVAGPLSDQLEGGSAPSFSMSRCRLQFSFIRICLILPFMYVH